MASQKTSDKSSSSARELKMLVKTKELLNENSESESESITSLSESSSDDDNSESLDDRREKIRKNEEKHNSRFHDEEHRKKKRRKEESSSEDGIASKTKKQSRKDDNDISWHRNKTSNLCDGDDKNTSSDSKYLARALKRRVKEEPRSSPEERLNESDFDKYKENIDSYGKKKGNFSADNIEEQRVSGSRDYNKFGKSEKNDKYDRQKRKGEHKHEHNAQKENEQHHKHMDKDHERDRTSKQRDRHENEEDKYLERHTKNEEKDRNYNRDRFNKERERPHEKEISYKRDRPNEDRGSAERHKSQEDRHYNESSERYGRERDRQYDDRKHHPKEMRGRQHKEQYRPNYHQDRHDREPDRHGETDRQRETDRHRMDRENEKQKKERRKDEREWDRRKHDNDGPIAGRADSEDSTRIDSSQTDEGGDKTKPKEEPNYELSGKLTEFTNTFKGVVIKYNEPPEARKPKTRWRLYPFKGDQELPVLHLHRQSAYLLGRNRMIADIPVDHPSCSSQHAVLQFRLVDHERPDGMMGKRVKPYVIDLDSSNGTFVNNNKIEPRRYYELREKDVLKFGFSSREYVMLHDKSKDDEPDEEEAENDTK